MKERNPSAFPSPGVAFKGEPGEYWAGVYEGMTLRDYFAAKAMQPILDQKDVHDGRELTNAAWVAYQMADAMLAERAKAAA